MLKRFVVIIKKWNFATYFYKKVNFLYDIRNLYSYQNIIVMKNFLFFLVIIKKNGILQLTFTKMLNFIYAIRNLYSYQHIILP